MGTDLHPFRIAVSDSELADLQARLALTRWPTEIGDNGDWQAGVNLDYMRELTDYWRTGYDWRAQEAAMNAFPHFRTQIDDVPIHFIHVKGQGPNPMPLIIQPWLAMDLLGHAQDHRSLERPCGPWR